MLIPDSVFLITRVNNYYVFLSIFPAFCVSVYFEGV